MLSKEPIDVVSVSSCGYKDNAFGTDQNMEMDFLGLALFRQETIYDSRYRMALEREFININKFAWPDPN